MSLAWKTELFWHPWRIFNFCDEWFWSWQRGSGLLLLVKFSVVNRTTVCGLRDWIAGSDGQIQPVLGICWGFQQWWELWGGPAEKQTERDVDIYSRVCTTHFSLMQLLIGLWQATTRSARSWFVCNPALQKRDVACVDPCFLPTSFHVFHSSQMVLTVGFSDQD